MTARLRLLERDGVTLAVHESGAADAPPVVLLHGLGFSAQAFRHQLEDPALTEVARLVAVDLRGHGSSSPGPGSRASADDLAADLDAVLDTLELARVTVVAWSYSGLVLGHYLERFGADRVAGVNLVAAAHRAGPDTLADFGEDAAPAGLLSDDSGERRHGVAAFVSAGQGRGQLSPADLTELEQVVGLSDPRTLLSMLGCVCDHRQLYGRLEVPMLLSHGTHDRINLPLMTERLGGVAPGATVSWYDGTGHLPFWEHPHRFNRELLELLASQRSATQGPSAR